jgi:chemotaxis protein MotB
VAYADFVTALMALFIALWVMNSDSDVKRAVSRYFKDPRGYSVAAAGGPAALGAVPPAPRANMAEIQSEIERALRAAPEFQRIRRNVVLSVTAEGLRIELVETEQGMFFDNGSPNPTEAGRLLLKLLAAEIGRMPNAVAIEGHTDDRPFRDAAPAAAYGNWELSTERANAARRLLRLYGMGAGQVVEVRGFAERRPMDAANPSSVRNRRISLVVQFALAGGAK